MAENTYDMVNDRILAALDAGTIPWRRGWAAMGGAEGLPRNLEGRRYSGINNLMLQITALARGYTDPRWATYRLALAKGGQVRRGEKATPVTYWTFLKKTDAETGRIKTIPFLRTYNVFNVAQMDGIAPLAPVTPVAEWQAVEAADAVIENMPNRPALSHDGGNRAFYRPATDSIHLPLREAFLTAGGFYETILHEMIHSTGHPTRCARKADEHQWTVFGSEPYAREELVAELGAAFILAEVGLDSDDSVQNVAAYIASWKRTVAEDPKALVVAAGAAQRAADYILGRSALETYGEEAA